MRPRVGDQIDQTVRVARGLATGVTVSDELAASGKDLVGFAHRCRERRRLARPRPWPTCRHFAYCPSTAVWRSNSRDRGSKYQTRLWGPGAAKHLADRARLGANASGSNPTRESTPGASAGVALRFVDRVRLVGERFLRHRVDWKVVSEAKCDLQLPELFLPLGSVEVVPYQPGPVGGSHDTAGRGENPL